MGETSGRRALDVLNEKISQEAEMTRLLQRMQGVDSRLVRIQGGRQYTKEEFRIPVKLNSTRGEYEYESLPFVHVHFGFGGQSYKLKNEQLIKCEDVAQKLAVVMREIDSRLRVSSFATHGDSDQIFLGL